MKRLLRQVRSRFGSNAPPSALPNIVMILLDQFRNDARPTHDVFDLLQQRGVLFSHMITYAPYTLASLHATFTGMYERENGVDAYTKSPQFDAKHCYTLTQYLRDAGYDTRGYTFSPILLPHAGFDTLNIVPEADEPDVLQNHRQELETCFGQARPFFLYLHYPEIHRQVVRQVIRKYDDFSEDYFGHVGRNTERYHTYTHEAGAYTAALLETIDAFDPSGDNTLLIVLTDHGAGLGEKPGEKAYGIFTYDYSVWVWVYVIWPKRLPANREITCQVRSIDILPTVLDLVGATPSKRRKPIMGRSLLPFIEGREAGHRLAFVETGGVEGPYPSPNAPNICAVRDGHWKLIYNRTMNKFELYDVEQDPHETRNLYTTYPEKGAELWQCMAQYL